MFAHNNYIHFLLPTSHLHLQIDGFNEAAWLLRFKAEHGLRSERD